MKKKTSLFLMPALVFAFSMPAFAADEVSAPTPHVPPAPMVTATSTAIGAEVGGTGDFNWAEQGKTAPVIAVGTQANVSAVGAYIGDSKGQFLAMNHAQVTGGTFAIAVGANDKVSNESITAHGAFIVNSGYGNNASSSNIVLASDSLGSKGNTVVATGAEISGQYDNSGKVLGTAGNFNTASSSAPVFALVAGSNNSAMAFGSLISGTGNNFNTASSSAPVFALAAGSNNFATAIGASISGTGSNNRATSSGIVIAKIGNIKNGRN